MYQPLPQSWLRAADVLSADLVEGGELLVRFDETDAERFATDAEREVGPDDPRVKSLREGLGDASRTLQNDSQ
jgi:multidrug resistance efflux pump